MENDRLQDEAKAAAVSRFDVGEHVERTSDDRQGVVREVEQRFLGLGETSYRLKWHDGGAEWEGVKNLRPG